MGSESAWITLHHKPLKEVSKKKLIDEFEDPEAVLRLPAETIAEITGESSFEIGPFRNEEVDTHGILRDMRKHGISIVRYCDDDFPPLLREISDPPMMLYARGDTRCLRARSVAVVGSRASAREAEAWTERLGELLGGAGIMTTSGLARGIDAAAHRGALVSGRTAAVLGNGLTRVFPPGNKTLARRIENGGGVLVSEFAPRVAPEADHFPKRNRIVTGMSEAVVLVQASSRSGASITSRLAAEYDRDLYALIASPWDGRFAGNLKYLRDGATSLIDPENVLEYMHCGPVAGSAGDTSAGAPEPAIPSEPWGAKTRSIVERLRLDDADLETLCTNLALSSDDVLHRIARLEMSGLVEELPGQRFHWSGPVVEA